MTNPADVVENLTLLLEGPPVKEDQAENIIEIVNVFAAASGGQFEIIKRLFQ